MTRKDYQVIANSVVNMAERIDGKSRATVIEQLAHDLKQANPNFDTVKFYQACACHIDN
jgi:hypothetical protein